MPPNSDAVVWPTSTAPASRRRAVVVASYSAIAVLEHQRRLGLGPALDRVELLHPDRDATERQRDVGAGCRFPGLFLVDEAHRVQFRVRYGRQRSLERLGGRDGARPVGVDEGAGVSHPWFCRHETRGYRTQPAADPSRSPSEAMRCTGRPRSLQIDRSAAVPVAWSGADPSHTAKKDTSAPRLAAELIAAVKTALVILSNALSQVGTASIRATEVANSRILSKRGIHDGPPGATDRSTNSASVPGMKTCT